MVFWLLHHLFFYYHVLLWCFNYCTICCCYCFLITGYIFFIVIFSFNIYFDLFYSNKGSFKNTSLPPRSRPKICVHSTLFKFHLWDFTKYIIIIIQHYIDLRQIQNIFSSKNIKIQPPYCINVQQNVRMWTHSKSYLRQSFSYFFPSLRETNLLLFLYLKVLQLQGKNQSEVVNHLFWKLNFLVSGVFSIIIKSIT